MRFAVCFFLCLACSSAFGQQKEVFFDVDVGDVFVTTDNVFCVFNFLWLDEAAKSFKAGDIEGLKALGESRKIGRIAKNGTLRILNVENPSDFNPIGYAECRVVRDDKAVAKVYVFLMYFSDKRMMKR